MSDDLVDTDVATTRHRRLPAVLVIVATILAVISTMTTWARTQALDTDQWVEVSGELLNEQEVQEALSVYLSDELFTAIDVRAELEARLPEDLTGLAGPLAGALRGPATDGIERIVASSRFQAAWQSANRVAHEAAVRILRDDTRDSVSWFLFFVIVVMYAAAVYLAVGRRRQVLRSVGISLIVGGFALLLIRAAGIRTSVDIFVEDATNKPLAELVASVMTVLLRQMAWTGVVYGLLIVAFATLLGPHRWAVTTRRWIAGVTESTSAVVGVCFGAVLVLLWWSPGGAFDRWITALVLVGLVIGAIVALVVTGRQELAADPPAPGPPTPSDPDPTPLTEPDVVTENA